MGKKTNETEKNVCGKTLFEMLFLHFIRVCVFLSSSDFVVDFAGNSIQTLLYQHFQEPIEIPRNTAIDREQVSGWGERVSERN